MSHNPTLITRYQRLLQDAERAGLRMPTTVSLRAVASSEGEDITATIDATTSTLEGEFPLANCAKFEDRVSKVLSLVAERGLGEHAMLYLLRHNVLTLVGQRGTCPDASRMETLVTDFLRVELKETDPLVIDPSDMVTSTVDESDWVGPSGVHFTPALLSHPEAEGLAVTGVLVCELEGLYQPGNRLLSDVSLAFAAAKDVVPLLVRARF
jgi:hypothetical protein